MPNTEPIEARFLAFLRRLMQSQRFRVVQADAPAGKQFFDLMLDSPTGTRAVLEAKLYRSLSAPAENLRLAAARLETGRRMHQAPFGILATNSRIDAPTKKHLTHDYPEIRLYDVDVLWGLCNREPTLSEELDEIVRDALVFRGEDLPNPQPSGEEELDYLVAAPIAFQFGREAPKVPQRGHDLCQAIKGVPAKAAKKFETACEAAIRFLFDRELVGWDHQHGTHTGLHKYDLVARVASKEDFWQALITDFRARYVIFEFKNYANQISQREIYTTEKYLYPAAMRGAAMIISTLGADSGADSAMRGALREAGKLILSLSVDELCDMLHAKDRGDDHMAILIRKLDDMLMGIER